MRITCRTPSTGKPVRIGTTNVPADEYLTIANPPDYSVPDPSFKYPVRDPEDPARAIRPGEMFLLTPLMAMNRDTEDRWIEVRLVTELTNEIFVVGKVEVPAGDTVFIPIQGRSLFKRDPDAINGDLLQVKAEVAGVFDVWGAGSESVSPENSGVIKIT